jgi:predicted nucleotidyltransferase
MPINIRVDHLTIVQDILRQHVPSCRVLAFGSRVKLTARDTSDLDLCVVGAKPLPMIKLAELRDAFSDSNLPYKVDVVDWATMTPDFQVLVTDNCFELQHPGTQ